VKHVTPAQDQEMLADLSDPGANNRVTVTFSTAPRPEDVLEEFNPVTGLSPNVELFDENGATVRSTASLRRNVLVIDPLTAASPVLAQGRYTLVLSSAIRSARGGLLNGGKRDFVLSFLVGHLDFPPVLRDVRPSAGDKPVGRRTPLVATFDQAVDAGSARTAVRVEDRSTTPATLIATRVTLAHRGRDVVVRPKSPAGYPAGAALTLVISGRKTGTGTPTSVLTDTTRVPFERDQSPLWTVDASSSTLFHSVIGDYDEASGEFTATFQTKRAAR
jgi:hypothetical protein